MRQRAAATVFLVFTLLFAFTPAGCTGPQGISVLNANVNSSGHLVLALSNGQTVDAGSVIGPAGAAGAAGASGVQGPTGNAGPAGATGIAGPQGPTGAAGPVGPVGPVGPAGPAGSNGTVGQTQSVNALVGTINSTLVYIDVATGLFRESIGTGVIISRLGYILTAYHVVAGFTAIDVTLSNGSTIPATFVAGARLRDWAVIKLNTVPANLSVAQLASSATAKVGDQVVAGGFALAYTPNPSYTIGIISAFRKLPDNFNYIQTDAAINSGDSGGPLFNMLGQVIGIVDSADVLNDLGDPVMNMGYCLPMDELLPLIGQWVGG